MARHTKRLGQALTVLLSTLPVRALAGPPPALQVTPQAITISHDGQQLAVSLQCPRFTLGDKTFGQEAKIDSVKGDIVTGKPVEVTFKPVSLGPSGQLEVKLLVQWSAKELILRKWAKFRVTGTSGPLVVKEIVLEDLDLGSEKVEFQGDGTQSYPAFWKGFFAGIEFPIGATRVANSHLLVAHRPGTRMQQGTWYESRKAVFGAAPVGEEKQAFESYVSAHRPSPKGLHIDYNSWWTTSVPFTETEILGLMQVFEQKLYKPYHASFDSFCIDMGWSDPNSIWEIGPKLFPDGFTKIVDGIGKSNSHLGLWISPSSHYGEAVNNDWAAANGYETFGDPGGRQLCLAGKKYREAFRDHLVDKVKRYGIRQVKFDGYTFQCPSSDHGHEPGALSAEAVADGMIEILEAVRKASPDLWEETTCFWFNPSPWWAFHSNSVIGTFGNDAPTGRVPCPIYRDSATTGRDYFNLQGANLMAMPIPAQEVLGVIHQSPDPFLNDAMTVLMRGHMFLPMYINPKFMDDDRWKQMAEFMTWARANAPALAETEILLPESWQGGKCPKITYDAVMPREPYGYAHWVDGKGLVALRNPWLAAMSYPIKIEGIPAGTKVSAVSLYPEVRVYAENLHSGDTLDVPLAPYETLVLSINGKQSAKGLPEATDVLATGAKVSGLREEAAMVEIRGDAAAFGPSWTSNTGDAKSGIWIEGEAEVEVPKTGAELLILRENKVALTPPICQAIVDGKEVKAFEVGNSDAGWASGSPNPDQWVFMRYRLPVGKHRIGFNALGEKKDDRLSAWVWSNKSGRTAAPAYPNAAPRPELISISSVKLADSGTQKLKTVQREQPVTRIDGIYLDSLEPTSVTIGWGKLERNQSVNQTPPVIGTTRYVRGIGTHAPSHITYDLAGKYRRFQAWVGPDAGGSIPSITIDVLIDGKKVWESGLMTKGAAAKRVDINVAGAKTMELIVGDGGDGIASDWCDLADAMLLK